MASPIVGRALKTLLVVIRQNRHPEANANPFGDLVQSAEHDLRAWRGRKTG
jgi:hypothetical protein